MMRIPGRDVPLHITVVVCIHGHDPLMADRKKLFDAQVEVEEPVAEAPAVPAFPASPGDSSNQQKEAAGVDPSGPSGHIPDSVMSKLQDDFKRARANRIQADLDKAQAENARLLTLLQQAQLHPKP
ncbi:hypothetical protein Dimus_005012 [Dionaea muscipula]